MSVLWVWVHMNENEENNRHHDNLEVHFDVLGQVGALYGGEKTTESEKLKETKCIKNVFQATRCAFSGEGGKGNRRDKVKEEGAFQILLTDNVGVSNLDALLGIQKARPEANNDIHEEAEVDKSINARNDATR